MRSVLRPRYLLLALLIAAASLPLLQRAATAHGAQDAPPSLATAPHAGTSAAPASLPAPSAATAGNSMPGPSARSVLDAAQALPADFQADVLLRLAAAPDLPADDGSDRAAAAQRLAQQAAMLAERAQRRMPGLARVGYVNDERDDELRAPRTAGLDRLTLQTRAAQLVAPAQAAALFAALPTPQPGSCDAAYLDDPSPAYALAGARLPAQPGARADALVARLDAARRETDTAPALKLALSAAPLDDAGQAQLATSLARMFERLRGDDAGFTATELSVAGDVPLLLQQLSDTALRDRVHGAYRGYVAAHLAQDRCPSSTRGNHWLLEQRFVAELPAERIAPAPPPSAASFDEDATSLIRQAGYNIRTQLLDPAADALATESASMEFLDQIDHGVLQQAATDDASGQLQRARLRELLRYLEYAPAGAARDRGMALLATLLSGPHYARDHDTWFGDLGVLAAQAQRWPDRAQRLAQLAAHTDPVVRVYAMLMQRRQFS